MGQAWEFKHPEFKANNKDSLDNIRRKAPAPRKPPQAIDDVMPTQHLDIVNSLLATTREQLQDLSQKYQDLSIRHAVMMQEIIGVQKTVVNHEHVMQNVMSFLHSVDARHRRDSKSGGPFSHGDNGNTNSAQMDPAHQQISPMDDEPASPLQHASKLLNDLNADVHLNYKTLEYMSDLHNRTNGSMTTPPPDSASRNGNPRPPNSAGSSSSLGYAKLHLETEAVVYPVGQTNGIDPMYSEHIHNIPYPMPSKDQEAVDSRRPPLYGRKKSTQVDPGWIRSPQILLVEDDHTCRRIGGKFLDSFHCSIDCAVSYRQ